MKSTTIFYICVGVLLLILVYYWFGRRSFERFFGGQSSILVQWAAPPSYSNPQNLVYTWNICSCPTSSSQCLSGAPPSSFSQTSCSDPSTWNTPTSSQTTSATQVTLSDVLAAGFDYGDSISFAVMAKDTVTGESSGWTSFVIDLAGQLTTSSITITADSLITHPLSDADIGVNVVYVLSGNLPTTPYNTLARIEIIRSATTFVTAIPSSDINFTGTNSGNPPYNTITITTDNAESGLTWSGGQNPGPYQTGDKMNMYVAIVSPASDGPVLYYAVASTVVAGPLTPAAPVSLSWQTA